MSNTANLDHHRRVALLGAAAGLVVGLAGCTGAMPHQGAAAAHPNATRFATVVAARLPRTVGSAPAGPAATGYRGPHFRTPRGAMMYLAAAYNRRDKSALHAVTTPQAYKLLIGMRSQAIDLQLNSCSATGHGDYDCTFTHEYPRKLHESGHGGSVMVVAPARNPGWYMYTLLDCG